MCVCARCTIALFVYCCCNWYIGFRFYYFLILRNSILQKKMRDRDPAMDYVIAIALSSVGLICILISTWNDSFVCIAMQFELRLFLPISSGWLTGFPFLNLWFWIWNWNKILPSAFCLIEVNLMNWESRIGKHKATKSATFERRQCSV